jgi:hypothetical protein
LQLKVLQLMPGIPSESMRSWMKSPRSGAN